MAKSMDWLLDGPAWMQYRIRRDLLKQSENDPDVAKARQAMMADSRLKDLIVELAGWPGAILNSHKSAGHPIHKLTFVADLGLKAGDPGIDKIIKLVIGHQSADGPFQSLMNISPRYGGSGKDEWAWALCDAPLILYALVEFGLGDDPKVIAGIEHLVGLIRDNGWPCAASPELGRFRGPGRKDDPCPYANLAMLKLLALTEQWRRSEAANKGLQAQLDLWSMSREKHPYMFYMGTDFRKLKAPFVWYDILHVFDVLSRFPQIRKDERLKEIAQTIKDKSDNEGRYRPESIWKAWSDWEFGQKKAPSRWVTFLVERAMRRAQFSFE